MLNIRTAILIIKSASQFIDIQVSGNAYSTFIDSFLSEDPDIWNLDNFNRCFCQCKELLYKPVQDCLWILINHLGLFDVFKENFEICPNQLLFLKKDNEFYLNIAMFSNNSGILNCFWEGEWRNLAAIPNQYTSNEKPYSLFWKFKAASYPIDNFILTYNPSHLLSEYISNNPKRALGTPQRLQNNSISSLASQEHLRSLENELADLKNQLQIKDQKIQELEIENQRILIDSYQNKNKDIPDTSLSVNIIKNPEELKTALNNPSKNPLPNYGNTCYLNSIVQIMASMDNFILELRKSKDSTLACLGNLLIDMRLPHKINEVNFGIRQLKNYLSQAFPNLNNNDQQDLKEVLEMILSKFEEEFPNSHLFVSDSTRILKCHYHNYCNIIKDSQNFIIIPPIYYNNIQEYLQTLKNSIFFENNDLLKCDLCGKNSISMMKSVIITKPIYLILSFPSMDAELRLVESLNFEEIQYSLFGVVSYSTSGASGHYTAYTKENYIWTHYNDEHIESVYSFDRVRGAYLAFYVSNF